VPNRTGGQYGEVRLGTNRKGSLLARGLRRATVFHVTFLSDSPVTGTTSRGFRLARRPVINGGGRMPFSDVLCAAIRARRLLEFEYGGLHRVVAPYCHGFSKRGAEVLRAVQVRGESRSGGLGFGKLWTVAEMDEVRASDETFLADDPHYNPNDSAIPQIHCRI
jgi:hypothetical protein